MMKTVFFSNVVWNTVCQTFLHKPKIGKTKNTSLSTKSELTSKSDVLQNMNTVIRSNDLISNTPKNTLTAFNLHYFTIHLIILRIILTAKIIKSKQKKSSCY